MAGALGGALITDLIATINIAFRSSCSGFQFAAILRLTLLCVVPMLLGASADKSPQLRVLAEKTPIAYANLETGKGGQATVLMAKLLSKAKLTHSFEYAPWKRAYRLITTQKNIILYPMGRTPEREDSFHWLGKITPVHYYLFGHQAGIRKNPSIWAGLLRADVELNELRHLSVGVVNGSLFHSYLLKHGFSKLAVVNSGRQNIDKAYRGRIDLFAASSAGLHNLCTVKKMDCSHFNVVLKLDELSSGLYFAASKTSDPDVVEALKEAYMSVFRSGELEEIMGERGRLEHMDASLQYFSLPGS